MSSPEMSRSLTFSTIARELGTIARHHGLHAVGFRSPPHGPGNRTIRRTDGGATVAVRIADRPMGDVARDMLAGMLLANNLPPTECGRLEAEVLPDLLERLGEPAP